MNPPRLRLWLLGSFRLAREGQPSRLPTRKAESLLAFLVLLQLGGSVVWAF